MKSELQKVPTLRPHGDFYPSGAFFVLYKAELFFRDAAKVAGLKRSICF